MNQCLGIGVVGSEDMAARQQLPAQLGVIIDFAVEDDADGLVLVPHRLVTARRIQYGEAAMAKMHRMRRIDMEALAVRPAMGKRGGHGVESLHTAFADKPGQSTHLSN